MSLLTPQEITLIRTSFDTILEQLEQDTDLSHRIYLRLFELAPEARAMFSADMRQQEQKLVAMFARIIGALSNEAKFSQLTKTLGASHKDHGVKAAHYMVLKQAILQAFDDIHPRAFDKPTLEAWDKAFMALARAMCAITDPKGTL